MTAPLPTVSDWKAIERNTLRGFFTAHLPSGMTLFENTLHYRDGHWWVMPPSKPMLSKDGTAPREAEAIAHECADRTIARQAAKLLGMLGSDHAGERYHVVRIARTASGQARTVVQHMARHVHLARVCPSEAAT
jgi:hypothetical protein